jgi:O-antigen ligase
MSIVISESKPMPKLAQPKEWSVYALIFLFPIAGSGAAARFGMWRAGWLVFQDAPILGVIRGNYTRAAQQYVDQGRLPPGVAQHGHANNAFVDMLIAGGLVVFFSWNVRQVNERSG